MDKENEKLMVELIKKLQDNIVINNQRLTLLNEKIDLVRDMVIAHMKGEAECETSSED